MSTQDNDVFPGDCLIENCLITVIRRHKYK